MMLRRLVGWMLVLMAALVGLAARQPVMAGCQDGDGGENTLICSSDPNADNLDNSVEGGLGDDTITVNNGVSVDGVAGDGDPNQTNGAMGAGDGGDDSIVNNGVAATSGLLGDNVTGDGGDDTIVNNGTAAGITGDGALGNGGNDLLINNATVSGIMGDGAIGNGGDDTIINNGIVAALTGDAVGGNGGDDSIVNTNTADAINGDGGANDGGDDTIVNTGTVAVLNGDSVSGNGGNDSIVNTGRADIIIGDSATGDGGDDTIVHTGAANVIYGDSAATNGNDRFQIGGVVEFWVFADSSDPQTGGEDRIELLDGAAGGSDSLLDIDGGAGDDTLAFRFSTEDKTQYDDFVSQFAIAVTQTSFNGMGTVTWNGQTFRWTNIEELENLIRLIVAESGGSGEVVITHDNRINWMDVAAPAALYCTADGGVVVYAIGASGQGVAIYSVTGMDIAARVAALGGVVGQVDGSSLNADGAGIVSFVFGSYNFSFSATACGAAA